MDNLTDELLGLVTDPAWGVLLGALLATLAALILHRTGNAVLRRIARGPVARAVVNSCARPARMALPLIALQSVWQAAPDSILLISQVRHGNALLLMVAITWLVLNALEGMTKGISERHSFDVADNHDARRIMTQTRVLVRVASTGVVVAGLAMMLMTFPGARQVGASLLASAGVLGLVVGIAARPVLSNMIAGLQLALAQPIRLDDVLILKGEWGRIEEITATYVVLKIWDERRLIIPLHWFIENTFENWTRNSSKIMGSVLLWVDYRMPLAPLREEAQRVCEAAAEWDKRVCVLEVLEAGQSSIQLRVLVTSADASLNWNLRCKVREALVDFMQREYPQHLPMMRAELAAPRSPLAPASAHGLLPESPVHPLPR
jgi:small-conductance mechanosensitive channel